MKKMFKSNNSLIELNLGYFKLPEKKKDYFDLKDKKEERGEEIAKKIIKKYRSNKQNRN